MFSKGDGGELISKLRGKIDSSDSFNYNTDNMIANEGQKAPEFDQVVSTQPQKAEYLDDRGDAGMHSHGAYAHNDGLSGMGLMSGSESVASGNSSVAYHHGQQAGGGVAASRNPRPIPGVWRDSLCDCGRNLFPSCWCSFCCCHGAWMLGMVSERTGSLRLSVVVISYAVLITLVAFVNLGAHNYGLGTVFTMVLLPFVLMGLYSAWVRMHVVSRMGIRAWSSSHTCNAVLEGCVGLLCTPCSVAQMARHVYGYTKVMDGDSDPHRPEMYDSLPETRPLAAL